MPLSSLDQLLQRILAQPQWEKQRRFHELANCWYQIIPPRIAQNTRPYCLKEDTLFISTSSFSWSQNLSLQRYSLLQKINHRVSQPIKALSFSSARWYPYTESNHLTKQVDDNKIHPSIITNQDNLTEIMEKRSPSNLPSNPSTNPQSALQEWFNHIQQKNQSYPSCPNCQALTPQGEIDRWGVCACCFAQKTNNSMNNE